ncbi:hypothetical protein EHQ27_04055 [Leptospira wolffii]|uniref:hypothetical protein n=1 Tax=Leptospira wolffii TaxID=409998 RepID=UPI0002F8EADA|nr:hypothetical protein [Leptospira wolffii]EPG65219.1 hypothetical protein LEP1GSC061_2630 [Leptospira wolffii serovar Khorat str. Khorat-H2]TGK61686.1 hypothetical protein EHQ32_02190 [Leptospira wolffii]TGK70230.1 hypothetical protein EHQ35_17605 [Leptospira wolffii]TGK77153.1 hypothetical protein EHQ27_04055 [Leptospira wolffii]TGL30995.1 hypothetical protein EHQ57_06205 [Leptospira wolffii]
MGLRTAKDWNQFLLRFFVALGIWEIASVTLRTLLFSVFYYDPNLKSFFVPVSQIVWVGPIVADLLQVFFLGVIVSLARPSLPYGIIGGLLVGMLFSVAAYAAPALAISQFTGAFPVKIVWLWVFYQTILTLITSLAFSFTAEEE